MKSRFTWKMISVFMVAIMTLSLFAGGSFGFSDVLIVQAAEGYEPGLSTYATAAQLGDDTFTPSDGICANVAKIYFGEYNGEPVSWHVLGRDSGVAGDNTMLFAAQSLGEAAFQDSVSIPTEDNSGTTYILYHQLSDAGNYDAEPNKYLYISHYGASSLRKSVLRDMVTNYFDSAEQDMMNNTTVSTVDLCQTGSPTYTTSDKLYALYAQNTALDEMIGIGSNNVLLSAAAYWKDANSFWLRTSDVNNVLHSHVAYVNTDAKIHGTSYHPVSYSDVDIRPAANIKLSDVLFASSAATAVSGGAIAGTIPSDKTMNLRLDGSNKNIGTAIYTNDTVTATKGSTGETVAVVIQGNDGVNDWYYSEEITSAEVIESSDIKNALNLTSDIDLSECKIWLEIISDSNLKYAINAERAEATADPVISYDENSFSVSVSGNGTVRLYVDGVEVSSPYSFTQTETKKTYVVTATAQENGKFISNTVSKNITVPAVPANFSIGTYATADQLGDSTTFTPSSINGVGNNIVQVYFGEKDGTPIPWYILGGDSSVQGNNMMLFATTNLGSGKFCAEPNGSDATAMPYEDGDGDYSSTAPSSVYANHYGASNLREFFNNMATDSGVFSEEERALLNETTITTYDVKNDTYYTTEDKLYALQVVGNALCIGPENTMLSRGIYWEDGVFLSRTPDVNIDFDFYDESAYCRWIYIMNVSGNPITSTASTFSNGYRPATNIDLSDVLFASCAAVRTTSEYYSNTYSSNNPPPLTLRLDGSDKNIGTVTYAGDTITAKKGTTDETVAIVIQGKGNNRDWSCSKVITGKETITKEDIENSSSMFTVSGELSDCRIWLEIVSEDNLKYAVTATRGIEKQTQTITAGDMTMTYGETKSISATTDGEGAVTYAVETGTDVVNVTADGTITALKAGVAIVKITAAETNEHKEATIDISITVNKAENAPYMPPVTMNVSYDAETVGAVTLPTGWEWVVEDISVALIAGEAVNATAVYRGADAGNYETETVEIAITRSVCNHSGGTELRDVSEATCTIDGYTGDTYCMGCGGRISVGQGISATGHDYKSEITTEATTTSAGVRTYTCDNCGDNYTESIPKLPTSTPMPTIAPTSAPMPTIAPTSAPMPTIAPTSAPMPTIAPISTPMPTIAPTSAPMPTIAPISTPMPTIAPTSAPMPTIAPISTPMPAVTPVSEKEEVPCIKGKDDKSGWDAIHEEIEKKIADADSPEEKVVVTINMNGTTKVPKEVFEQIAYKNISVEFVLANGLKWTVNGTTVKAQERKEIDFAVIMDSEENPLGSIPAKVIHMVAGESNSVAIQLAHSGVFAFEAVLTIELDKKDAGLVANLFFYNADTEKLEFVCADIIAKDGTADLAFSHASDYLIVMSEASMEPKAEDEVPEMKEPVLKKGYAVQIGAFLNEANAKRWKQQGETNGVPMVVIEDGKYFKVQTNVFETREEAVAIAMLFSAAGFDNFILETKRRLILNEEEMPEEPVLPLETDQKKIEVLAKEVIDGKWGNGKERKDRLTRAGYDYREVQNKVNELLK